MKTKNTAAFLLALAAAASAITMPVSAAQFIDGDIDGDGAVNAVDATWILQYAAYVGAGGTESIREFVPTAETEADPEEEPEYLPYDPEEYTAHELADMTGKTLEAVLMDGFDYYYDTNVPGYYSTTVGSSTYSDEGAEALVESIQGKTVAELVEEYNIHIYCIRMSDVEENYGYIDLYTANIGDVFFRFELQNAYEVVLNNADNPDFELETAPEIQNDVPANLKIEFVSYSIEYDEASTRKLQSYGTDAMQYEELLLIADELVIDRMYYLLP